MRRWRRMSGRDAMYDMLGIYPAVGAIEVADNVGAPLVETVFGSDAALTTFAEGRSIMLRQRQHERIVFQRKAEMHGVASFMETERWT